MKNRENPHNSTHTHTHTHTHTNVFKERGKLLFSRLFSFNCKGGSRLNFLQGGVLRG